MIDPRDFYDSLAANGVTFYTGVPDSLLKSFCSYVADHQSNHVIAANEGGAVALAAGQYLATGQLALVYMQNSGFGNAINPLVSLADPTVYGVPMLLLIGWRGEPGKKDEPQHTKQGLTTIGLLETLEMPYAVLEASTSSAEAIARDAAALAGQRSCPYAIVVREGTFKEYPLQRDGNTGYPLTREEALTTVLDGIDAGTAVVSTTGMASREVFEYRDRRGQGHAGDFLTVGSMGHASQIAMGIALAQPCREVCCLDGDGAVLMHLGGMAVIGSVAPPNFRHIVLNNGAHDSVGGQPTAAFQIDLPAIASACGYHQCISARTAAEICAGIETLGRVPGPTFLEIKVRTGSRMGLGRPTSSPAENKARFMEFLGR